MKLLPSLAVSIATTCAIALLLWGSPSGSAWASTDELRDYGEYLAGECTTCHRLDGTDKGIPSIVGWDTESFIETLKYYKTGERKNEAMESVAKQLDDEMMKALAVYFGSLKPKDDD